MDGISPLRKLTCRVGSKLVLFKRNSKSVVNVRLRRGEMIFVLFFEHLETIRVAKVYSFGNSDSSS